MRPRCFSPAVYHHGPRVWRIARFHPPEEGQEGGGVLGHPVVWPGRELELPHLPLLAGAVLQIGWERARGQCLAVAAAAVSHSKAAYFEKRECPDAVRGQLHGVQQRHLDEAVRLGPSCWPVLVAFYLEWRRIEER